ncbi:hypothetical protein [Rhodovulum strictum]|uniref:Uncharacterized protein n=1 Tax=Rhodovulum strictum TaxID=58314 RepID=A0A844BED8_9RHOB|nr:hypothetical protein [Rhodovulum strictum]MRH19675.1 hypothetical protein [Rhodovulum strictum]
MSHVHSSFKESGLVPGSMLPGFENREIASCVSERHVPTNVFCYSRPDLWQDRIWRVLSDYITDDVKAAFLDDLPEYIVSDDLSWLDTIIERVVGEWPDIKEVTADRLVHEFDAFRMFHATRTNDLAAFYQNGLRFMTNRDIEDRARIIFLNGSFPRVSEEKLSAAIAELNGGHHANRFDLKPRIYCCADENDFTTRLGNSGHYLDFGSEYLFNLGSCLTSCSEAKQALREIGSPTMFVIDVPMHLINRSTILEFSGNVLEFLFSSLSDSLEARALSPGAGTVIILRNEIPANAFVGHFHPKHFFHSHK